MCNATNNTETREAHPFQTAGLGIAPFRFVGMTRKVGPVMCDDGTQIGAPGQPMGTCDYCGMGIADCYEVASADGKTFVVGCDCITKVYKGYGKESTDPVKRAIDNARKAAQRNARHAREAAKLAEYRAWVDANRGALEALPHGRGTAIESVEWYAKNAGTSGNLALYGKLRKMLEG